MLPSVSAEHDRGQLCPNVSWVQYSRVAPGVEKKWVSNGARIV